MKMLTSISLRLEIYKNLPTGWKMNISFIRIGMKMGFKFFLRGRGGFSKRLEYEECKTGSQMCIRDGKKPKLLGNNWIIQEKC